MIPCSYWALACEAVLPSCVTSYVVSVRQARGLPVVSLFPHPASFRFHLTMDTLAFGYILPTTRRIRDFHPLETCAAGRTSSKKSPFRRTGTSLIEDRCHSSHICCFMYQLIYFAESSDHGSVHVFRRIVREDQIVPGRDGSRRLRCVERNVVDAAHFAAVLLLSDA